MKNNLLSILAFFVAMHSFAQISGKVIDNNNEPLPSVSILIKGTEKGTETDFDGNFNINNVSGEQTLVISSIGYKTKEIKVTAPNNSVSIVLYEGTELLQEVILTSRKNTFARKKTAYVAKLPLKDMENTTVYSTVTNELLESQIVTDLDQAMTNATGVYKLWEATGRGPGSGTSFYSMRGFSVQPQLVDGIAGVTFSAVEPSYIERVEVIKGPTATLFGSTETSLGGLINVVTKKPYKGEGGSVSYTTGSFGMHRASIDYNTEIGSSDNAFFRINASYLTQNSFQDAGFKKTFFVAPSATFKINDRLNISAGLEFSRTKQTNPSMLFLRRGFGLVSTNIDEMGVDPKKSFTSNDIYLTNPVFNTRVIGDYKISDNWTSQTVFSSTYAEAAGDYQYQFDGGAGGILQLNSIFEIPQLQPVLPSITPVIQPIIGDMTNEALTLLGRDAFTRVYSRRDANEIQFNIQQNFIGDFKIGDVRNRMVIGLDYLNNVRDSKNKNGNPTVTSQSRFPELLGFFNSNPLLAPIGQGLNQTFSNFPYFDAFVAANGSVIPSSFTPNATYIPSKADLDAVFNDMTPDYRKFSYKTLALYVSDVINIRPDLTVNVGLRLDHFIQDGRIATPNDNTPNLSEDDYTKTTLSPNIGVLYQPIMNKLSVFANYQTGFTNIDPEVDFNTGEVRVFQPEKGKQFEGGIKTNFFNGRLGLGASYYHITVNDYATGDPSAPIFPVSTDVEEVVSKGFEIELNTNPFEGLNIRAGFSKNDMKFTDVKSEISGREITEILGRRPVSAGPETLYNFWADYQFSEGSFAEKFGIGAGFNGASKHLTTNNNVVGVFTLPSYTIFNASLYYNADKFRIGFKVNNLTDETYYTGWGTINAQAPRSFLGTISYKF